ncbi:MAG: sulfide/dihydroorotate dehydrogenase-like FAD/NAD-binding protein [Candidatus Acetothermia bacterium]|jgi:ferredoxin--NADP+ reductase|nr:sulfide/dihydroorotate dehydrogenase-like FAD/NAD-binding protein [Candidatus Acetothermia bacterium]MDH7504920.1 sulfide/dihydroorotate dehydrogenase-like FAD/NAD-binding protein [Candidatus Acetothermia bacterium]
MGYEILEKRALAPGIKLFRIRAPLVARKVRAGHFVVIRLDERGERIPLTPLEADPQAGTVTLVVQEVGKTTKQLGEMEPGGELMNFVGPLGNPFPVKRYGKVIIVGGGVGVVPAYHVAKELKSLNWVGSIIGARTKELLILEEMFRQISDEVHITTDDGSYGRKGFVTEALDELLARDSADLVVAIGPVPMMKAAVEVTKRHGVKTLVDVNPIMVDATGMCGCCRVEVGGETKFACVDGPTFDGWLVNFDLLTRRLNQYRDQERLALARYEEERRTRS